MENNLNKKQKAITDVPVAAACIIIVAVFVALVCIFQEATLDIVGNIFNAVIAVAAEPILWFVLLSLAVCLYIALSKHGNVKLGEGEPQYSMFSYLGMMLCASLAATAAFYSFIEWSYYYESPAFGIEPYSEEAAEWSITYAFFHWGFSCESIFALAAIPMAYGYYVKKIDSLRISKICGAMMGNFKYRGPLEKVIDALTIISIVGGLGVSLGLGLPLVTAGICKIFGFQASFLLNLVVLLIMAAIFTISSIVGIDRGMKKLSDFTLYAAIFLIAFVFILGPTEFIWSELTYSFGKMIQHFPEMSLYTDPVRASGFADINTIFVFALALTYAGMMGIFITKISKGRTLREMILTEVVGLTMGVMILFGVNGAFGLHSELTGAFELTKAVDEQAGVMDLLGVLPLGELFLPIVYTLVIIGMLTTSLDSASFTLATSSSKQLDENGNPSTKLRIVWCAMLTLIPLSIIFVGGEFTTIRYLCIILSIPFVLILVGMYIGLFKWFKEDGN